MKEMKQIYVCPKTWVIPFGDEILAQITDSIGIEDDFDAKENTFTDFEGDPFGDLWDDDNTSNMDPWGEE
ncbi:MAG: hypothetical protein IKH99_04630 [Prevotella sp.]|nr:hypothetical protein [Prevotella sp.]